MPGLTAQSLFPLSAKTMGLEFERLVEVLSQIVGGDQNEK